MSADLICAGTLSVGATMGHQEGIWVVTVELVLFLSRHDDGCQILW